MSGKLVISHTDACYTDLSYLNEEIDENNFTKIGELLPYFLCLVRAMYNFNCITAIFVHQMGLHPGCLLQNVCSSLFFSRNENLCSRSLLCELSSNFSANRVWSVSSKKGPGEALYDADVRRSNHSGCQI